MNNIDHSAPEKQYYGFFSQKAYDHGCHAMYYRTTTGREVLITTIDADPNAPSYLWSDKKCLGQVVELIRHDPTHPPECHLGK